MSEKILQSQIRILDDSYSKWNQAIGKWFFKSENAGEIVAFSIDDDVLFDIGQKYIFHFNNSDDAKEDFLKAVRKEINLNGWQIGRLIKDQYPYFLALIAVQILAAFSMRDEEEFTHNAYWPRLQEILGENVKLPSNRNFETHRNLWRSGLEKWVNEIMAGNIGKIILPEDKKKSHTRNTRLPISQCLLNKNDLEEIKIIFDKAGFRPYEDIDINTLKKEIDNNKNFLKCHCKHCKKILEDEYRRENAYKQIQNNLLKWDGSITLSEKSVNKKDKVNLYFELDEEDSELSCFIKIQEVKNKINNIEQFFDNWQIPDTSINYKPYHDDFLIAVYDYFDECYLEKRKAEIENEVLLITKFSNYELRMQIEKYICKNDINEWWVSSNSDDENQLNGLPKTWIAYQFKITEKMLEYFDWIRADKLLQLEGGLRLEYKTWMVGAGPNIINHSSSNIVISHNGEILSQQKQPQCLKEPGNYKVWLQGCDGNCLSFSIKEPNVPNIDAPNNKNGWFFENNNWGRLIDNDKVISDGLQLIGVQIAGKTPTVHVIVTSSEQNWIEANLVLQNKKTRTFFQNIFEDENLIVNAISKAINRRTTK